MTIVHCHAIDNDIELDDRFDATTLWDHVEIPLPKTASVLLEQCLFLNTIANYTYDVHRLFPHCCEKLVLVIIHEGFQLL